MKYWLIFMIFTSDGEFLTKFEYPAKNKTHCVELAGYTAQQYVNRGRLTQAWCVTDNHFKGRKQDPGIPYD